jgi:hypothetical protein
MMIVIMIRSEWIFPQLMIALRPMTLWLASVVLFNRQRLKFRTKTERSAIILDANGRESVRQTKENMKQDIRNSSNAMNQIVPVKMDLGPLMILNGIRNVCTTRSQTADPRRNICASERIVLGRTNYGLDWIIFAST